VPQGDDEGFLNGILGAHSVAQHRHRHAVQRRTMAFQGSAQTGDITAASTLNQLSVEYRRSLHVFRMRHRPKKFAKKRSNFVSGPRIWVDMQSGEIRTRRR